MITQTQFSMTLLAALIGYGGAVYAETSSSPLPVWNHAYQENYDADIILGARNAYVLLDPFLEPLKTNFGTTIAKINENGNEIAAYISVGTGEVWRDDFTQLKPYLVTRQWSEWDGEYFVSTPNDAVVAIMKARIDRVAGLGFDWVEFDNMDWIHDDEYCAEYMIDSSVEDGTAYYRELCAHVRDHGMKCMAKNTVEDANDFDGVTYESFPGNKTGGMRRAQSSSYRPTSR
jgi:endo-alpha-1,4-polygalactosaminidase (GH114 family)